MSSKEKNSRRLTDVLPAELTDTPIIGMTGNREITVDGFRCVEEYTETEITFRAGCFLMTVRGISLAIRFLSLHTIVVSGEISAVEFAK